MALSDSRRRANDRYIKDHYARVALSMPKDEAAALDEYCKRHNLSKAGFIRALIKDAISAGDPDEGTRGVSAEAVGGGVTPPNNREEEK